MGKSSLNLGLSSHATEVKVCLRLHPLRERVGLVFNKMLHARRKLRTTGAKDADWKSYNTLVRMCVFSQRTNT